MCLINHIVNPDEFRHMGITIIIFVFKQIHSNKHEYIRSITVTLQPDIRSVHYSVTMLPLAFLQRLIIHFYHKYMNKADKQEQNYNCCIQNNNNVPAVLLCTSHIWHFMRSKHWAINKNLVLLWALDRVSTDFHTHTWKEPNIYCMYGVKTILKMHA